MSMIDTAAAEQKIAERINPEVTKTLAVSGSAGGLAFVDMSQAMEFAKLMAVSSLAVPQHLRGNAGACLAIVIQAVEWRLSPYAVANKSYSVNNRMAYESQLVQAVILQRAPIDGRFMVEYKGEGSHRICRVSVKLRNSDQIVSYESPPLGKITPQNSPLWKSDPDQQQFYYSGRALCRRHFPDVLLGVYTEEELYEQGPDHARDVTPRTLTDRLDALAASPAASKPNGEISASPSGRAPTADEAVSDDFGTSETVSSIVTTEAGYREWANVWIENAVDSAAAQKRWKDEKDLRNDCNVSPEVRDALKAELDKKFPEAQRARA